MTIATRAFAACLLAGTVSACGGAPGRQSIDSTRDARRSILPKGPPSDFFAPQPVGDPIRGNQRPRIAQVEIADLDGDGLPDILVCDAAQNRVTWIRQAPGSTIIAIRTLGGRPLRRDWRGAVGCVGFAP